MPITNLDTLIDSMANRAQQMVTNKASIANAVAGQYFSMWRATGTPGQGAIPAAAAVCTAATTGAYPLTNATGGRSLYLSRANFIGSNNATDVQIHDRLIAMGGLSGTVTTAQTVNVDAGDAALATRRGDSNYSDVQFWLEWYTDTGATASNATVAVTYDDGSTGNLAAIAVGGTVRAGRMIPLVPAVAGRYIRSVQSVTLSGTTGAAGSFGVTATRLRSSMTLGLANAGVVYDWQMMGLPQVFDNSCLQTIVVCGATSTGTLNGAFRIAEG